MLLDEGVRQGKGVKAKEASDKVTRAVWGIIYADDADILSRIDVLRCFVLAHQPSAARPDILRCLCMYALRWTEAK